MTDNLTTLQEEIESLQSQLEILGKQNVVSEYIKKSSELREKQIKLNELKTK